MKINSKRSLGAAALAIAVTVPLALAPGAAYAGSNDFETEVEASFRVDGTRYTIDADGDEDDGDGTWRARRNGNTAKGKILKVCGSELGDNDGKAAWIVVKVTDGGAGFVKDDFVKQFLHDRRGPDRHKINKDADNKNCNDGFDEPHNTDNVKGDIDVDIDD